MANDDRYANDRNYDSDDEVNFKPGYTDDETDNFCTGVSELSEGEIDADLDASEEQNSSRMPVHTLSREDRIKQIDAEMKEKINELHELMSEGGLVESAQRLADITPALTGSYKRKHSNVESTQNKAQAKTHDGNVNTNQNATFRGRCETADINNSRSEETIYQNAIPAKRNSSSSEDDGLLNSSDEGNIPDAIDRLLISERRSADVNKAQPRQSKQRDPQPGCSYDQHERTPRRELDPLPQVLRGESEESDVSPETRAKQLVQEAEQAKAKIYSTKGMLDTKNQYVHSAMVDEDYMIIGGYVEEPMVKKIILGEYVDFGKLLPKDRIIMEEDSRMEMVIRGGRTYWVPVNETVSINSFSRWEQAFRVYSNIYTRAHPNRSSELIQYNHVIHTISQQYVWENVYNYDKEFRIHLARNPGRSWSVILHQAWAMRLKDRIYRGEGGFHNGRNSHSGYSGSNSQEKVRVNEPCRRFNRGNCSYGGRCKYEHKCSYCKKFGHGFVRCRKMLADKEKGIVKQEKGTNDFVPQISTEAAPATNPHK